MKKIFRYSFLSITFLVLALIVWITSSSFSEAKLPPLKDGDLVFQTIKSPQSVAIMKASSTVYTHIGIVKIAPNGEAIVIEAVGPVREVAIDEWIKQGVGNFITVKRYKDQDNLPIQKIFKAAKKHYGKPYDFFFLFDDERVYCSELVYNAFKDGADIELGKIEKVSDLGVNNIAARKLIEQRWQQHPLCQKSRMTLESCNKIIMSQELVTPASIAEDERLELIYSNYSPF